MATLYVVEPGAYLSRDHGRIMVSTDDKVIASVPFADVDSVVLLGNIGVTMPVLHALLDQQASLILLDGRGAFRGRLSKPVGKNLNLRRSQHDRARSAPFCLEIARSIVGGKLRNYRAIARRIARSHHVEESVFHRLNLSIQQAARAPDLETLRGIEGGGSRAYFSALRRGISGELALGPRTRRPPRDAVNALLSLGYTLLSHNAMTACEIAGLDPYDGFYHSDRYGRPALALDLMEEFRGVIVDSVVLNLVNRGRLGDRDFEAGPAGDFCLSHKAMRTFFRAYSARMETEVKVSGIDRPLSYRKILEVQARRVRKVIEGLAEAYQPFLTR